ncbi:Ig-like domain-containing protein, partial [Psychromonas algicola]|uniref:Ig-like domain-containing protein n=1 Tax=Psychromonas algicola TaxID=2555642 RepID=UPI001419904B
MAKQTNSENNDIEVVTVSSENNQTEVVTVEELLNSAEVEELLEPEEVLPADIDELLALGEEVFDLDIETAAGEVSDGGSSRLVEFERDAQETLAKTDFETNSFESSSSQLTNDFIDSNINLNNSVESNVAPVAQAAASAVVEDTVISGNINATDANSGDQGNLTFSTTSAATGLILNADGSYSFDSSSYDNLQIDEELVLEIPITVSDAQGASDTTTLTITITGTNDSPIAQAATAFVEEDNTIFTGNINATDIDLPDGASLSFTTDSEVVGFILNDDGSYSLDTSLYASLSEDEIENIQIPVTVTDDQGATDTTTLTITIFGNNDAPIIDVVNTTVTEDTATIVATASDVDGTITESSLSADNGSVSLDANGNITYTPDANFAGEDSISVSVTDNDGATSTQTITVNVTEVNDAPVIDVVSTTVTEDTATIVATASDVDGTITESSLSADNGSVSLDANGNITYTPDANFVGEDSISVSVTDNDGATSTQTITVSVTEVNDAPVIDVVSTT